MGTGGDASGAVANLGVGASSRNRHTLTLTVWGGAQGAGLPRGSARRASRRVGCRASPAMPAGDVENFFVVELLVGGGNVG